MGSSDRSPRGLRKVAVSATGREGGSSPDLPAESANGRFSKGLEEGRAALGAAIGRAMHQLAIEVLKLEEGQQPDKATSTAIPDFTMASWLEARELEQQQDCATSAASLAIDMVDLDVEMGDDDDPFDVA